MQGRRPQTFSDPSGVLSVDPWALLWNSGAIWALGCNSCLHRPFWVPKDIQGPAWFLGVSARTLGTPLWPAIFLWYLFGVSVSHSGCPQPWVCGQFASRPTGSDSIMHMAYFKLGVGLWRSFVSWTKSKILCQWSKLGSNRWQVCVSLGSIWDQLQRSENPRVSLMY